VVSFFDLIVFDVADEASLGDDGDDGTGEGERKREREREGAEGKTDTRQQEIGVSGVQGTALLGLGSMRVCGLSVLSMTLDDSR